MMNRLQTLFSEKWAMSEVEFHHLMATFLPALAQGHLQEVENVLSQSGNRAYALDVNLINEYDFDAKTLPAGCVGVIVLQGVLYSWETSYLVRKLLEAEANPNICGVVLWINGPGGAVMGLDNAAATIEGLSKPVAAYIAGNCASAHYWIACSAGTRILGSRLGEVGSIGIVGTYYNEKKYLEKLGIDYREIYPDSADLKNKETREIDENNNEQPMKDRLGQVHTLFCETVARNIGLKYQSDSPVFRGATFMGQEAIDEGLVDRFGTMADAARWVIAQAAQRQYSKMMKS